jgi:FkbM family methyltransferase
MNSNITLELVDGVRVVVPDSLNRISTYVLSEQKDWFEDEIKFLRRLIRPGQKAIDIGANCGVYALTMARLVGPTGRVWAFEPASATANLLASGIGANNFTNLELVRSALSNAPGTAQLSISEHSELNELVRGTHPKGITETISCVTLDDSMVKYGWKDIDFVKIDAEGEETNILRAGNGFLAVESPLIQYEVKAATWNLELVERFLELGYQSYRLVPGIDLLVPYNIKEAVDPYLLNLFCCKPDKAARLATQGFLLETNAGISLAHLPDFRQLPGSPDPHEWRRALVELPYGALLADEWAQRMADAGSTAVEESLFHYALSRDTSVQAAGRFAALTASYLGFKRLCETQPANLRLSSLARVAIDYGARYVAVNALGQLCDLILGQQGQVNTSEPFLAPGARFDTISPGGRQGLPRWIAAAAFEELERSQHQSSFFAGKSSQRRLEMIRDLGFSSEEMQRRLLLVQRRFGAVAS